MRLITQGVRAVLFCDVASGLLHEEIACRLPFSLSKSMEFLKVLVSYGISLYAWSSTYYDKAKKSQLSLDDVEGYPRLLSLEMMFDHSENIYDSSLLRHDPIVEGHVKDCLYKLVPNDEALFTVPTTVTEGKGSSMLQFLSVDQFEARHKEVGIGWDVATVVLGHGKHTLQSRRLSAPLTKRLLQLKCIGKAGCQDSCTKRAIREARW